MGGISVKLQPAKVLGGAFFKGSMRLLVFSLLQVAEVYFCQ